MFDGFKSFWKGVYKKMFPQQTIKNVIQRDVCLSDTMARRIELWSAMYKGMGPWCDDYVKSLRKEQGICREFANICLNEMESEVSNEKLNELYKSAIKNLNENLQSGLALGSFCIKPLGEGKVEYITADRFIPVEFDARDRLIDVVFIQVKRIGDNNYYYRLERHSLKNQVLTITNRAFHSTNETDLGSEVSLDSVDEWAKLPPSISYQGLERPDFGYYRNPIKNEVDGSACGVSIFDSAIDQIRNADIQGARLDWEFESGERAVHVDIMALQSTAKVNAKGKTEMVTPRLNKRLFKGLNLQQGTDSELYKEWSPAFREDNILNGMNEYLRQIEFNVSLSYGDISNPENVEKTATECIVAKKRKYNMVTAIQVNLKECLEDLVYALAFYNAMTKTGYEFVCSFKDSILVDEETERAQDRQDVSMGVMSLVEYRMKWYNETEEQAMKMIPQQADVDTGGDE